MNFRIIYIQLVIKIEDMQSECVCAVIAVLVGSADGERLLGKALGSGKMNKKVSEQLVKLFRGRSVF